MNGREEEQLRTLYHYQANVIDARFFVDSIKRALRGEYPSVIVLEGQSELDEAKLDDFLKRMAQIISHNEPLQGWSKRIDSSTARHREVIQWTSSRGKNYVFKYNVEHANGRRWTGEVSLYNMNGTENDDSGYDTAELMQARMVGEIQRLHERLSVLEKFRALH